MVTSWWRELAAARAAEYAAIRAAADVAAAQDHRHSARPS
jgi:hypothetical protein